MEPAGHRLAIMWRHDEWRCEYWESRSGGTLRLYRGRALVENRGVDGPYETVRQSSAWLKQLRASTPSGAPQ
jgi:hypothetical protein